MNIAAPRKIECMPSLSEEEFNLLSKLIYNWSGIKLGEHKQPLLRSRLNHRLQALGLKSFMEYYELVSRQGLYGKESIKMLDAISTNLTEFFREPAHFDFLKRVFFPRWKNETNIRILSAGCSSGEEAYSIAICAREVFASSASIVQITAGDISARALRLANNGIYPFKSVQALPVERLRANFLRGTGSKEGLVAVAPEIRSMVTFQRMNLAEPLKFESRFHAIFCRNVVIYFDRPSQFRLVGWFAEALLPGGSLFLGHSESMLSENHDFIHVQPTVYDRRYRSGERHG